MLTKKRSTVNSSNTIANVKSKINRIKAKKKLLQYLNESIKPNKLNVNYDEFSDETVLQEYIKATILKVYVKGDIKNPLNVKRLTKHTDVRSQINQTKPVSRKVIKPVIVNVKPNKNKLKVTSFLIKQTTTELDKMIAYLSFKIECSLNANPADYNKHYLMAKQKKVCYY